MNRQLRSFVDSLTLTRSLLLITLLIAISLAVSIYGSSGVRNLLADKARLLLEFQADSLSPKQADRMARDLELKPDDFADRIELLDFYFGEEIENGLTPAHLARRREYILWTIANEPSSAFAGEYAMQFDRRADEPDQAGLAQAQRLWLEQVGQRPKDSRILRNAGEFFSSIGEFSQSESMLERARAIDPDNFDIAESLGTDYWHDARYAATTEGLRASSKQAMAIFNEALQKTSDRRKRSWMLPDAAQAAFEAGDQNKAIAWSNEMLTIAKVPDEFDNRADDVHYANLVLGRIALQHGDTEEAAAHLLKAGEVRGNPHLDTFGPNMMLASELLKKGDTPPVKSYLLACAKFWKDDDGKLAVWQADIDAGKTPDFGPNLRY